MKDVKYTPEPTAEKFHNSFAFVRGLKGPIGSGKSVACVQELMMIATQTQKPGTDNIRRTRFAIIRNTYPELKTTTIKTFQDWFGTAAPVKWSAPITARMITDDIGDGTGVDMEVFFIALDNEDDVKKLLSMELTAGWINEAREVSKAVLDALTGRVGRYPSKKDGGPTWCGVIMDTNPPSDDHWWYHFAEEETPENWQFFDQPPALIRHIKDGGGIEWLDNPNAENINNLALGYSYYRNQLGGKEERWIRVYVEGMYGTIIKGRPVFPEWRDDLHLAKKPIIADSNVPLLLGWDFGLTPACVIGQVSQRGQLRILAELVAERMGLKQFSKDVVKPFLASRLPGIPVSVSVADPAGVAGSQNDMESCISVLNNLGIQTQPAQTNKLEPRLQAVRDFLTNLVDGEPGFVLSRSCQVLRKGFNGGYKFERLKVSGTEDRYRDKPLKNSYSHPHDALQYLCLAANRVVTSLEVDMPGYANYGRTGTAGYSSATAAGY